MYEHFEKDIGLFYSDQLVAGNRVLPAPFRRASGHYKALFICGYTSNRRCDEYDRRSGA